MNVLPHLLSNFYVQVAVGYLGLCLIIGLLGRRTAMGGWGLFFGSIVLTPLMGLFLLLVSRPRK